MPEAGPILIYIDGGSRGNPGPAGYGVRVEDPDGRLIDEFKEAIGVATNNVAEYRALLAALDWARERGHRRVHVRSDSELLVKQMRGEYRVKHPGLEPLHADARIRAAAFDAVRFEHVRREQNAHADRLANEAMDAAAGHHNDAPAVAAATSAPDAARLSFERTLDRLDAEAADAVRRQDAAALAAWFAPDAVLLVPGHEPIRGRAAIERFYADSFGPPLHVREASFEHREFELSGDLAFETGANTLTVQPANQSRDTLFAGKFLSVWKRQPGGAWLLWRHAPSYNA